MDKLVIFEVKDNVAFVTPNRPDRRNALNHELLVCLYDAIERIRDDVQISVGIITGNGPAFCSGIDLSVIKTDNLFNLIARNVNCLNSWPSAKNQSSGQ